MRADKDKQDISWTNQQLESHNDESSAQTYQAQSRSSPRSYGGTDINASRRRDTATDFVTVNEERDLARGLHQRHISLIALAGAIVSPDFAALFFLFIVSTMGKTATCKNCPLDISASATRMCLMEIVAVIVDSHQQGTGLFLGLGSSIQTAGPLGALLGYATIGLIVCAVQFALGEVTALLPVTGSFVRHAEFLVDPALGFAIGYNIVYGNWLSIPAEISAICVLFQYWTDVNPSVWIVVVILATCIIGIAFIRIYGEIEFWFAIIKILLIIFLIILGLVINLGGVPGVPRLGFHYWKDPGPFVEFIAPGKWGNFLGYWAVMSNAVFSFAGTESIAMAAAETRNPRQVIPRACKRVFFRVTLFYILAVLVVGMLVSSDDERLDDESGTAAQSPFVIAASGAGIKAIPSVVNAVVITSAWSSSNQALLAGTRVLYGLALKGQAPRFFLRTTSWGVPYVCVSLQTIFMFLAFMSLSDGALTVFYWFVALTACGVLISWITILFNHLRLILAMKKQGISLDELPWHNGWTAYSTPAALFLCVVILFTAGFPVFTKGNWSSSGFVSSYLDIPLVITAFLLWKFIKQTKLVRLEDIPLREALDEVRRNPESPEPEIKGWQKAVGFLWD